MTGEVRGSEQPFRYQLDAKSISAGKRLAGRHIRLEREHGQYTVKVDTVFKRFLLEAVAFITGRKAPVYLEDQKTLHMMYSDKHAPDRLRNLILEKMGNALVAGRVEEGITDAAFLAQSKIMIWNSNKEQLLEDPLVCAILGDGIDTVSPEELVDRLLSYGYNPKERKCNPDVFANMVAQDLLTSDDPKFSILENEVKARLKKLSIEQLLIEQGVLEEMSAPYSDLWNIDSYRWDLSVVIKPIATPNTSLSEALVALSEKDQWKTDLSSWSQKNVDELKNALSPQFEKDVKRGLLNIGKTRSKEYGKAAAALRSLITKVVSKSRVTEQNIEIIRLQLEKLAHQGCFSMIPSCNRAFLESYTINGFQAVGLQYAEELKAKLAALGKENEIVHVQQQGHQLRLTATSFYRIADPSNPEKSVGYDAIRVNITIDLDKVQSEDLLLSNGAVQIKAETHGFSQTLDKMKW